MGTKQRKPLTYHNRLPQLKSNNPLIISQIPKVISQLSQDIWSRNSAEFGKSLRIRRPRSSQNCCQFYIKGSYKEREEAREFKISAEYQVYGLFCCFISCLKIKAYYEIWRQIQMDKSKVRWKFSSYCRRKKLIFLSPQLHCLHYLKII